MLHLDQTDQPVTQFGSKKFDTGFGKRGENVLKLLFLLPLGLCFIWFLYLRYSGYTVKQGKQGFIYILVFSGVIALFYTLMLYLTHR